MPREAYRDAAGDVWVLTPFVGSARGILTLCQLAAARDGGRIGNCEAVFVGLQLLGAVVHAHARGVVHGPIDADQVLVDPRGGLLVELYGVDRQLRDLPVATEADRAAEARSIVALVARLATGHLNPGPAALLEVPSALRGWIATGLSEAGFASAMLAECALAPVVQTLGTGNDGNRSWFADLTGFLGWALTRR
jgi:serine/threonine protein kinase